MKIELTIGRREAVIAGMLVCTGILGYKVGAAHADGPPDANALTYSGVLEQANGTPYTGSHSVLLQVWKNAAGTQAACAPPAPAQMDLGSSGKFQLTLSADCQAAFNANKDLWTQVSVDGSSTGISKVGAVPYALEAKHTLSADAATTATNAVNATTADTAGNTSSIAAAHAGVIVPVTFSSDTSVCYDAIIGTNTAEAGYRCPRACSDYCSSHGYAGGWFNGGAVPSPPPAIIGCECIR